MNPIMASIAAGYTAEEILNFMGKLFKGVSPKIADAASQGYSPDEILNFMKNFKKKDLKKFKAKKGQQVDFQFPTGAKEDASDLEVAFDNWYGPTAKEKQDNRLNRTLQPESSGMGGMLGNIAKTAAMAGGGYLLNKALPKAAKFVEPFISQMMGQPQAQPEGSPVQEQLDAQAITSPIETAANMRVDTPITEEVIEEFDPAPILEQAGLKQKVDELMSAGNTPEQISGYFEATMNNQQKKGVEQISPQPLDALITKYVANSQGQLQPQEQMEAIEQAPIEPMAQETLAPEEDLYEKAKPILENAERPNALTLQKELKIDLPEAQQLVEKYQDSFVNKLATLPDGEVAQVESVKDGIATIKVNGKERRRKIEDLETEPSELEPIVDSLLKAIPDDQKSAVLAFANYSNQFSFDHGGKKFDIPMMAIQFHSGDLYLYPGVSQEQYNRIVEKATPAKTSGDNSYHAWTQGKESRGAGFYEIKKQLEKEFGKNFIKFKANEGYDYWKTVREAIKQVEKRKKQSQKSN